MNNINDNRVRSMTYVSGTVPTNVTAPLTGPQVPAMGADKMIRAKSAGTVAVAPAKVKPSLFKTLLKATIAETAGNVAGGVVGVGIGLALGLSGGAIALLAIGGATVVGAGAFVWAGLKASKG